MAAWSRRASHAYGPAAILVVAGIGLWELLIRLLDVQHFIWPAPSLIAATIRDEIPDLGHHTLVTLGEVAAGFAVAVAAGLGLGILLHVSAIVRRALYPILIASQSVPTIVLAPVFALVLGYGLAPILAVIALFCFFPIVVGTIDGLRGVDREYVRMMLTLDASRTGIFRRVELPAALPLIFTGTRVSATYAAIGAVFGEWAGSDQGLGWQMLQAKGRLDTELVFADIVFITAMALALFGLVSLIERLAIPWARSGGPR
ncbi:MAG: ABC transporter permease [Thermoleophilia bacterium]|nr:ABC transporter permease [Thermoleophilia bacterium]